MSWYINRHVYYIHSEHFLSYLTLMHLLSMILTGYGVLRHCADLYEIQNNIWAISVAAVAFLCNLCATKGNDYFFQWFLPFTILFTLTCFLTLSAYHGAIMVFVVHFPLVIFVLTGIPCRIIFLLCIVAVILGTVFHVALVSSLYSDFQGHMSLSFLQNVSSWLRSPNARGFNVIMMDSYVVMLQIIIGVFCYQRYRKLGKLVAIHKARPIRYLGSFETIVALEEELFPSQSQCDMQHINTIIRKISEPVHQAPPRYLDHVVDDEKYITKFLDSNQALNRLPLEEMGRYRSRHIHQGHTDPGLSPQMLKPMFDSKSIETETDEGLRHRHEICGKRMEAVLQSYDINDHSPRPNDGDSSSITATRISIDSSATARMKNNVRWDSKSKTSSICSSISLSENSSNLSERPGAWGQSGQNRKKRTRSINLSPQSNVRTTERMLNMADSTSARSIECSALNSVQSSARGGSGLLRINATSHYGDNRLSKILKQDGQTAAALMLGGTQPFQAGKGINAADNDHVRPISFEGGSSLHHTEEGVLESGSRTEGKARIIRPTNLSAVSRINQRSLSSSDTSIGEPLTSNHTLNTLLRMMPLCCYRFCAKLINRVGLMCTDRDSMRQYTWTHKVRMPETNIFGIFTHTRVESWYVEWMNEFNMGLYFATAKETLIIFLMGVLSDLLLFVRLYMTLGTGKEMEQFFSGVRITILTLRYGLYPIGMVYVLCHLLFKKVKKKIVFYYRSILALCLFNIVLTFADMWSCLHVLNGGYSIQNSLYMCSMLTSAGLLLFTRVPTLLCIYVSCFIVYVFVLWQGGYGLGYSLLELFCQFVVALGCIIFCVRPVDTNRRMLFSSYTLPYLLYLEAMKY